ncbi:MAG TPA: penicillin-insensitive murein endopeptidase [Pseudolabrys sp.]|nr:penicillin-insensitive murein endopeptidase [Pseudolabrys sp.]
MIMRYAILLGATAAFVIVGLAAVEHVKVAQAQAPAATVDTPAAPQATEPAPPEAAPPQDVTAPTAPSTPTVENPLPENPTPLVTAPPAEPPAPVVTAPPAQPPAPVVTAPATPPEKPSTALDKTPAKQLFSSAKLPSLGKAVAIGYYPRGCLQGGVELPVNGPTWQVMRLSRNRNWGHPSLVRFLEKFAPAAAKATGWKGIMIGDMAQPRGGPLPFGHLSHQIGLDVDVWFMPMPGHVLSPEEREKTSATNLVADDWKHLNPKTWTPQHVAFIKTAAEQPNVERVLVNAVIKQELCRVDAKAPWLAKVRPWYGHHDHIHVRLACPADSPNCRKQPSVTGDDGCAPAALKYWFSDKVLHPPKPATPAKPPRPLMLSDLPPACKNVIDAPAKQVKAKAE